LPTEVQATPDSCKHRRLAIMAATTAGGDVETAQVVNPEPDSGLPDPGLEDHLSQQLICPISHCIMECPVISPSGHTYDRASILEWLSRHPIDPLSLAPVVPSMLYPNRSLQNEIAEQLERLAAQFTSAQATSLADAAKAKLRRVREAMGVQHAQSGEGCSEATRLDRRINFFTHYGVRCALLAWEQFLVFTTSFGALLCLAHDVRSSISGGHAAKGFAGRHPPMLQRFVRLALSWNKHALPPDWNAFERFTVVALRIVLLVPMGQCLLTVACGASLSLVRFAKRLWEVRALEAERAGRCHWFVRTRNICSAITGLSSFGLFWRLYRDSRK